MAVSAFIANLPKRVVREPTGAANRNRRHGLRLSNLPSIVPRAMRNFRIFSPQQAALYTPGIVCSRHGDTGQTFAGLKTRIASTLRFVQSVEPARLDGTEDRDITRTQ